MITYVARQPILNIKDETVGYELLFRDSHHNRYPQVDPDEATSQLITQSHLTFGLEDICQNKLAFINFHINTLLQNFPTSLDKRKTVIEILEDVPVTDDVINICQKLHESGYKLALDDHDFDMQWEVLYPYVTIIKVDILEHKLEDVVHFAQFMNEEFAHIQLLAEKVETQEQYVTLKESGYSLFQGYYFSRPEMIKRNSIDSNKLRLLDLIILVIDSNVTFDDIASVMETDPVISFKLLRFISSSSHAKNNKITTIKHALSYLGLAEVRKFIALIAFASLNEDNCSEILNMALLRAKFCENLDILIGNSDNSSTAYLMGLLSMISALLKTTPETIFSKIPISQDMQQALLKKEGRLGVLLLLCEVYETTDWPKAKEISELLELTLDDIANAYHQALAWQIDNPIET